MMKNLNLGVTHFHESILTSDLYSTKKKGNLKVLYFVRLVKMDLIFFYFSTTDGSN